MRLPLLDSSTIVLTGIKPVSTLRNYCLIGREQRKILSVGNGYGGGELERSWIEQETSEASNYRVPTKDASNPAIQRISYGRR
jgi:hypothetical protein